MTYEDRQSATLASFHEYTETLQRERDEARAQRDECKERSHANFLQEEQKLQEARDEADRLRGKRDALADALRGVLDVHDAYGSREREVVTERLDAAHKALAALEEDS